MKECKNEHKGVPVDTGAIKDFLTIIQQFFDTLCNVVLHFAFDFRCSSNKKPMPPSKTASRSTKVATDLILIIISIF